MLLNEAESNGNNYIIGCFGCARLFVKQLRTYSWDVQALGNLAGDHMRCFSHSSKIPREHWSLKVHLLWTLYIVHLDNVHARDALMLYLI